MGAITHEKAEGLKKDVKSTLKRVERSKRANMAEATKLKQAVQTKAVSEEHVLASNEKKNKVGVKASELKGKAEKASKLAKEQVTANLQNQKEGAKIHDEVLINAAHGFGDAEKRAQELEKADAKATA